MLVSCFKISAPDVQSAAQAQELADTWVHEQDVCTVETVSVHELHSDKRYSAEYEFRVHPYEMHFSGPAHVERTYFALEQSLHQMLAHYLG